MKARIKATGEIVEVISRWVTSISGYEVLKYIDQKTGVSYFEEELFFPKDLADDPDYWTRLEHQAAIGAMQGLLSSGKLNIIIKNIDILPEGIAIASRDFAHALVEKMKEVK